MRPWPQSNLEAGHRLGLGRHVSLQPSAWCPPASAPLRASILTETAPKDGRKKLQRDSNRQWGENPFSLAAVKRAKHMGARGGSSRTTIRCGWRLKGGGKLDTLAARHSEANNGKEGRRQGNGQVPWLFRAVSPSLSPHDESHDSPEATGRVNATRETGVKQEKAGVRSGVSGEATPGGSARSLLSTRGQCCCSRPLETSWHHGLRLYGVAGLSTSTMVWAQ